MHVDIDERNVVCWRMGRVALPFRILEAIPWVGSGKAVRCPALEFQAFVVYVVGGCTVLVQRIKLEHRVNEIAAVAISLGGELRALRSSASSYAIRCPSENGVSAACSCLETRERAVSRIAIAACRRRCPCRLIPAYFKRVRVADEDNIAPGKPDRTARGANSTRRWDLRYEP